MEIKRLIVKGDFKYFWLKSVHDVDLSNHCAKCLIGKYDARITNEKKEYHDIKLDDGVYYLCGVSMPFIWRNNFHLAFRSKKGDNVIVSFNGVEIEVKDAEQLPISSAYIIDDTKGAAFRTCRNWQFANFFERHLKKG